MQTGLNGDAFMRPRSMTVCITRDAKKLISRANQSYRHQTRHHPSYYHHSSSLVNNKVQVCMMTWQLLVCGHQMPFRCGICMPYE